MITFISELHFPVSFRSGALIPNTIVLGGGPLGGKRSGEGRPVMGLDPFLRRQ